jgi:hypothetical protein
VNGDDIGIGLGTDDAAAGQRWTYSTITNYTEQVDGVAQDWVSGAGLQTRDNVSAGATGNFAVTITRGAGAGNSGYSGIVVAIAAAAGASVTPPSQRSKPRMILRNRGKGFDSHAAPQFGVTLFADNTPQPTGAQNVAPIVLAKPIELIQYRLGPRAASIVPSSLTSAASPDVSVSINGQQIAFAQGIITVATDVLAGGQFVTFTQGTITPATAVFPSTLLITSALGTITPATSVAPSGLAVTFSLGTITPATAVLVSGQVITFAQGTSAAGSNGDVSLALTGQSFSAAQGTIIPATSVVPSGQVVTTAQGSLTGSDAVTLGGQFVTVSASSLGSDHSVTLSGSVITTALGAVKAAASVPLLGAQIATQQGSLGIAGDVTVSINGQFVTVQQGTLTGDSGLRLTPGVDKGKRPTKLPVNWPLTSVVQDIANNSPLRFGPVSASATGQVISISQGRLEVSSYRSREAQRRDNGDLVVPMAFSSEEPVERWWGIEVLDHGKDSIRLDRLNDGAPVLFNHNPNDLRGTHEPAPSR